MPKGYTTGMIIGRLCVMAAACLLVLSTVAAAKAKPSADPGEETALFLLKQTVRPARDGSHNALLRGLRQLDDPELLPLFNALSASPYLSMRVHGMLGAAELSPQRRLDLSQLAEIEDKRELVQVLSAGMDDGLIDQAGMATLLGWEGLELPLRQAIALRIVGEGGFVDTKPFAESLDIELNDELGAGRLLQYALAALVLAEAGDAAGKTALLKISKLQGVASTAVLGQVLDAAMRQGHASAGPLAMSLVKDAKRDASLRLLAIQTALRLGTNGASTAWQAMYQREESMPQRIRLAMVALDAADKLDSSVFDALGSDGEWVRLIGNAGRAVAEKRDDLLPAFKPMIATGQPLSVQWVVSYCRRDKPAEGAGLLEEVIKNHNAGSDRNRGKMAQAARSAATALCELYPDQAIERLPVLLEQATGAEEARGLPMRRLILLGIAQARGDGLKALAQQIETDAFNDFTTEVLRLNIRARHGAELTEKEWQRVSDIVQGVGQLDLSMRTQLGWAYLEHRGKADRAIVEALK